MRLRVGYHVSVDCITSTKSVFLPHGKIAITSVCLEFCIKSLFCGLKSVFLNKSHNISFEIFNKWWFENIKKKKKNYIFKSQVRRCVFKNIQF
jgi:hypothetical protein